MSDADRRQLERVAFVGDDYAQQRLEHMRCRTNEHCGCRVDISDLFNTHQTGVVGLNETPPSLFSPNEEGPYDADVLEARVVLKITSTNREDLFNRLQKLCDKLRIPGPPAANVIDRTCGFCKEGPGDPCTTSGGNRAKNFHVARTRPSGFISNCYDLFDEYRDYGHGGYGYGY